MEKRVCIVGLDKPEYTEIREQLNVPVIATEVLPKIAVIDGQLLVQPPNRMTLQPVSKIVFHGIFEDDMDFITGLALWGGPCLPNAAAMMDCRLKLPCLARALRYTKFGSPARGYAARGAMIETDQEYVAKWGNWHCGENKTRFSGTWTSEEPSIIEPFFEGQAVRILMIGEKAWQIRRERGADGHRPGTCGRYRAYSAGIRAGTPRQRLHCRERWDEAPAGSQPYPGHQPLPGSLGTLPGLCGRLDQSGLSEETRVHITNRLSAPFADFQTCTH
jgi:hypothetical protein